MKYKPMLAPNDQVELVDVKYPVLGSYKLDGIRCIFYKGEILSRSLKPIVNKQLRAKMQPLADYSREKNLILDGEFYNHNIPFGLISSCVMTQDVTDKKAIKSWAEKCEERDIEITREEAMNGIKFYCFDAIKGEEVEERFVDRCGYIRALTFNFPKSAVEVKQNILETAEEVESWFKTALDIGYEGLILKDPNGRYKCGRGTVKEALIYKVKPYRTFDGVIKEVIQATEVINSRLDMLKRLDADGVLDLHSNDLSENEVKVIYEGRYGALKTTNELGRSVTSKKKGDRILIEKACDFMVDYKGNNVKVVIAMTDAEKEEIWKNKEQYIGKVLEYKFMEVGMKKGGLPRHPTSIRIRYDKE